MQTLILILLAVLIVLLCLLISALFSFERAINHLASNVRDLEFANREVFKHIGLLDEEGKLVPLKRSKK